MSRDSKVNQYRDFRRDCQLYNYAFLINEIILLDRLYWNFLSKLHFAISQLIILHRNFLNFN